MTGTRAILDRLVAWSPVLLLGGLAALTYWLDAQIQAPASRDGATRHDPDIFVENFRAVNLDPNGKPMHILQARFARHFPDDGTTEFVDPRLEVNRADQVGFSVSADRGRLSGDRENAYFTGNVRAVREPDARGGDRDVGRIILTTDYLHVMPKEDKVETDRPVTIEEPRGIIRSSGLVFSDRDKTIKLRGGVRGTIEPRVLAK
jgi:lipopolysaccharide export system protein LptC